MDLDYIGNQRVSQGEDVCQLPTGGATVLGAGGVGAAVVAGGATVEPKVVANINYKTLSKKARAKSCNSITLKQNQHELFT